MPRRSEAERRSGESPDPADPRSAWRAAQGRSRRARPRTGPTVSSSSIARGETGAGPPRARRGASDASTPATPQAPSSAARTSSSRAVSSTGVSPDARSASPAPPAMRSTIRATSAGSTSRTAAPGRAPSSRDTRAAALRGTALAGRARPRSETSTPSSSESDRPAATAASPPAARATGVSAAKPRDTRGRSKGSAMRAAESTDRAGAVQPDFSRGWAAGRAGRWPAGHPRVRGAAYRASRSRTSRASAGATPGPGWLP